MDDSRWKAHYELIKRLYQDERKSLKFVRNILIDEHGFPELSLQKYERKFRDELGLRVKLKATDWSQIHQYAESHGYAQGSYDVVLNGTRLRPETVKKEIRRRKDQFDFQGFNGSLPCNVEVMCRASTSSRIVPQLTTPWQKPRHEAIVSDGADRTLKEPQSTARLSLISMPMLSLHQKGRENLQMTQETEFEVAFLEFIHEKLPWNEARRFVLAAANGRINLEDCRVLSGMRLFCIPDDGFTPGVREVVSARLASTVYPNSVGPLGDPSNDWTQTLLTLIYLLSNGLYKSNQFPQLLDLLWVIVRHSSFAVVTEVFKSGLPSIRALFSRCADEIWRIFESSNCHHLKRPYVFNIDFALQLFVRLLNFHPEWIEENQGNLLYISASLNCDSILAKTCSYGLRQKAFGKNGYWLSRTLIKAVVSGSSDWIKCFGSRFEPASGASDTPKTQEQGVCRTKVKATIPQRVVQNTFSRFCETMLFSSARVDNMGCYMETLKILLNLGADPDAPFSRKLNGEWLSLNEQCQFVRSSLLDASFCSCKPSFIEMSKFSLAYQQRHLFKLCRVGILANILQKEEAAQSFLVSLMIEEDKVVKSLLEHLLLEQFLNSTEDQQRRATFDRPRAYIARMLLKSGVAIRTSCLNNKLSNPLLTHWVKSVREYGLTADLKAILPYLSRLTSGLTEYLLYYSVEDEGTIILDALFECGLLQKKFAPLAASALIQAASIENYLAFDLLLLRLNANINDNFRTKFNREECYDHCDTGTIAHTLVSLYFEESFREDKFSIETFRHFLSLGARLRMSSEDRSCFLFVKHSLLYLRKKEVISRFFSVLMEYRSEIDLISSLEWGSIVRLMLHEEKRGHGTYIHRPSHDTDFWQLFEHILQAYHDSRSGPILTQLVLAGGSRKQIDGLINAGADVNEWDGFDTPLIAATRIHNLDLGYWLLDRGANPAGNVDSGVLHECCSIETCSPLEQSRKMAFLARIISMGTDVNCHTIRGNEEIGSTPLHSCARTGDIEAATYLMKYKADPNLAGYFACGYFSVRGKLKQQWFALTALDVAIEHGRLDMAQLLLQYGAISAFPGLTGFQGVADATGAFQELIKQHTLTNNELFSRSPASLRGHEAIIESLQRKSRILFQRYQQDGQLCHNAILVDTKGGVKVRLEFWQ